MNYYQNQALMNSYPPYGGINQQQNQQITYGGIVQINNENEVLSYPVAPGASVVFINPSQMLMYVKTMGFSQLEQPRIEKYRYHRESQAEPAQAPAPNGAPAPAAVPAPAPAPAADAAKIDALQRQIDEIKSILIESADKEAAKNE